MVQQVIDVGINADSGDGDSLYESGNKINSNFNEFFDLVPVAADIKFLGNNITSRLSNADIDIHPSGTGSILFPGIRINDNNIEAVNTNDDLRISASGSGQVVISGLGFVGTSINATDSSSVNINENLIVDGTMSATGTFAFGSAKTFITGSTFGTLTLANGSITDSSGAIDFGNEDLTTTGTFSTGTGTTVGNITLANGSITDSSGAISFGNENLTTTGTLSAATGSIFGNLTLANGSITDSGGAIDFGNENLTTTGTSFAINSTLIVANGSITDSSGAIDFGNENLTTTGTIARATGSTIGNLTLANGSITDSSGTISFGNENLTTSASSMAINSTLSAGSGSITDTSGAFTFVNENLTTTGNLTVDGASTLGSMSVSGATSFGSAMTVDNLTFNDNIISTSSNADLNLTPGGTGVVNVANLTIDSSINFTDNVIKVTTSNADLVLSANGSGSVVINNIDLDSGTIDNTIIGANEPSTGLFDSSNLNYTTLVIPTKLTFSGNTLSTSRSNDNLEFAGNGTGTVIVDGLYMPTADGQTGEFLQTNGSGVISFGSTGVALGVSDIQDARNSIGFSSITEIDTNTATGSHESLGSTVSVIDEFDQTKYDSAWYLLLSRSVAADSAIEYQFQKAIIAQGTADGSTFESNIGVSQVLRSSTSDAEVDLTSDVRSAVSNVRLLGRGGLLADSSVSDNHAVTYFRVGLGDDDSSGTQAGSGLAQTKLVADLDSAEATLDSWASGSYRGAKYFISINNTTTNEVSSTEVMVVHDGTNAFIMEYNTIASNDGVTPLATFTVDIDSGNVRLRGANGTAGTCRVVMYRILLSDAESNSNGTYVDVIGAKTVEQITRTTIDHVTTAIVSVQGLEVEEIVDIFASSLYDSAWYLTVLRDQTSGRLSFHKYSVLHGTSDDSSIQAFITDSGVLRSEEFDVATAEVDVDDGNIRLKLTGQNDGSTAVNNTVTSYRIGLGDSDSTGYTGEESTLSTVEINTDVDSASEAIDSFAHADHRGAKYFVSVMNASGGEVMNVELLVVHDGSAAYITSYNEVSSGNTGAATTDTLATFTAAISGSNVVVSAAGLDTNLRIHMYRILLADDQSATTSTNVNVISAVTVSSSATTIDTFSTNTYAAAHYIIIGSAGDGKSIMEATVISDGTTASVSEGPQVSTKGTAQLELTASHSSTTTTLLASSTSGGSTTVNSYRIHLPKSSGTTYTEIDSIAQSSKQAVFYVATTKQTDNKSSIDEIAVISDGADAYHVSLGVNTDSSSTDLVTYTTVVDSGAIKLRAQLADEQASAVINVFKIELARAEGDPLSIATLDSWSASTYRSAIYNVSIEDSGSGVNGLYETCEVRITHDGTTVYLSVFGRITNHTGDLVTFTGDISGGNVRLRGTISNTNTHQVTVVRRVIVV